MNDILLVGGCGVVGRRIARDLALQFPGRLIIAGRRLSETEAFCAQLGHGSRARFIDVAHAPSIAAALRGIATVVVCVAQVEPHLLHAAIDGGLAYTELAPRLAFIRVGTALTVRARNTGARVVLGAGLSPGISNMMASQLEDALGAVEEIETAIALSLGDKYGPDSLRHMLDAVARPFSITVQGHTRDAMPFEEPRLVEFPQPIGSRLAYLFPWSDAVSYPQTLGAQSSCGRFALEPAWLGRAIAGLLRHGARRWLSTSRVVHAPGGVIHRLRQLYRGQDDFALVVTARGSGSVLRMSLVGRGQADATAAGAAEMARALAAGEVREPGVWYPEEILAHTAFLRAMADKGLPPHIEVLSASSREVAERAAVVRRELGALGTLRT